MCGIAGIYKFNGHSEVDRQTLARMIASLSHRGPDGYGFFVNERLGLAHARLSIIDLEGGWQPIHNEEKTLWVIFNGEIFNYRELRQQLEERGHRFYTNSDTEVIVHLYEERGEQCLEELNGQFAIALYDSRDKSLFLARDRLGIRPLFYGWHNKVFYFGSEVKAIFAASPEIPRRINPAVLAETFTYWMPAVQATVFDGISQLLPGHWARLDDQGRFTSRSYWDIPFAEQAASVDASAEEYGARLRELLIDSVRLRLRADVPVGAYLSGGIDSSVITSLVRNYTNNPLKTFSVTFQDAVYDERHQQQEMVRFLNTDHHTLDCDYQKIAAVFPEVIWHTETPVLRTAPTPLFLLSGLVRQCNYKVVLTGEGADEILGGYDIFKEAKIRAFIRANPASSRRAYLLKRLYPYLALSPTRSAEYAKKFFDSEAPLDDLFYAHRPRWKTTAGTHLFLSEQVVNSMATDPADRLREAYQDKLAGLDYFSRAQYLEMKLLLANYLLSSQGDRMAMAHSVEGRFPFLDHRVVEFACTVPPRYRMSALNEKYLLKKAMAPLLPAAIVKRRKQPYMAPDILSFFGTPAAPYLDYYLSESLLQEAGLFKPRAVAQLIAKCRKGSRQGFRENMAFVGILSSQILFDKFVKGFPRLGPVELSRVRVVS